MKSTRDDDGPGLCERAVADGVEITCGCVPRWLTVAKEVAWPVREGAR